MRDVELVEDEVEDIDIIACRVAFDVEELKGPEVPVADNDQRMGFGIFEVFVGSM